MTPPERLIVTAVMATLVADNPQELVPLATKNSTEGQTLRKGYLGAIFGGTAPVENRARQMDSNDLGENGDPHVSCNPSLRRKLRGGKAHSLQRLLRVRFESFLDPRDFAVQALLLFLGPGFGLGEELGLQRMLQPAFVAPEVINVLCLEEPIKTRTQRGGALLRYL